MVKFSLATNKGEISLEDEFLTVEKIENYADMLGVPRENSTPTTQAPSQPKRKVEDAPLNVVSKVATEDVDGNPYKRVRAVYDCPTCGNSDSSEVLEWFRFIKCGECRTKIYLTPVDPNLSVEDDEFELYGSAPYFTYEERQAHKQQTTHNNLLEVRDGDGSLEVMYDEVRVEGKRALSKYSLDALLYFITHHDLDSSVSQRDEMCQVIYEYVKYGLK